MKHPGVAAWAAAAVLAAGHARAQTVVFTSDVGLIAYTVRADRAAAMETVLDRLVQGLKAPASAEHPRLAVSLRVLKAVDPAGGNVMYVLLTEAPLAGVDYSIDRL